MSTMPLPQALQLPAKLKWAKSPKSRAKKARKLIEQGRVVAPTNHDRSLEEEFRAALPPLGNAAHAVLLAHEHLADQGTETLR